MSTSWNPISKQCKETSLPYIISFLIICYTQISVAVWKKRSVATFGFNHDFKILIKSPTISLIIRGMYHIMEVNQISTISFTFYISYDVKEIDIWGLNSLFFSPAENKESVVGKIKEEKDQSDALESLHSKASSLEQGSTLRDLLTTTAGKLRLGSTDAGIAFAPVYSTASQVRKPTPTDHTQTERLCQHTEMATYIQNQWKVKKCTNLTLKGFGSKGLFLILVSRIVL